mmetsp:Transcript_35196/g.83377  ORF Transcript_35196/g.83377 Transcript_35196/m.83377 type:complete len:210 (+) Transcript_35196:299-928(+)
MGIRWLCTQRSRRRLPLAPPTSPANQARRSQRTDVTGLGRGLTARPTTPPTSSSKSTARSRVTRCSSTTRSRFAPLTAPTSSPLSWCCATSSRSSQRASGSECPSLSRTSRQGLSSASGLRQPSSASSRGRATWMCMLSSSRITRGSPSTRWRIMCCLSWWRDPNFTGRSPTSRCSRATSTGRDSCWERSRLAPTRSETSLATASCASL